jgi:serine/threonine/tyrosine-interacting protein
MDNFQDVNYVKACQICNARRFCCSFDDNIKNYLKSYDDILTARRTVAAASGFSSPGGTFNPVTSPFFGSPNPHPDRMLAQAPPVIASNGNAKRGRERDEDEMEVDDTATEDEERFMGRETAPFR